MLIQLTDLQKADSLRKHDSIRVALVYYKKAAKLYNVSENSKEWWKCISGIIDCNTETKNYTTAFTIIDSLQPVIKRSHDPTGSLNAALLYKKASIYADLRQTDSSISLFNRNIDILLRKKNITDTTLALSYNGVATIYMMNGNNKVAFDIYSDALKASEKANRTESSDYAMFMQNKGIACTLLGLYEQAETYFTKSLQTYQKVLPPDAVKIASLYLNLGRFYQLVRNDTKALECMQKAETIYQKQPSKNQEFLGPLYLNIALTYIYTGDNEKAILYLDKSLNIITTHTPEKKWDLMTIYLNLGFIAEKKNDLQGARNFYLKALSMGEDLPNSVKVLRGLATVSYKLNESSEAAKYYKLALKKSIERNGENHPETALTYLRYGDFLSATGNPGALTNLEKALQSYHKTFGPLNVDVSTAYYYIGLHYKRIKHYEKAASYFQHALVSGFPGFNSENLNDNPTLKQENLNENLLNSIQAKSDILYKLFTVNHEHTDYLNASAAAYELTIEMIEKLRSSYQNEESKLFISEFQRNTYANALLAQKEKLNISHDAKDLAKSFNIAERGKAAVLLSYLRDIDAKNTIRISKTLHDKELDIKTQLYFYNKQLYEEKLKIKPDPDKLTNWQNKIFELNRKKDELLKEVEKDYPEYYSLKFDNSVISIEQVTRDLDPSQVLIEYSICDSVLCTFTICDGHSYLQTQKIDTAFFGKMHLLKNQLSGDSFLDYNLNDYKSFVRTSFELYNILIKPSLAYIKQKDLIIIPDGEISYIPFDVLLTSLPDTLRQAYKNLPYLIKDHAINYTPSATTFFENLVNKIGDHNGHVLAFAPDYSKSNAVLDSKTESGKTIRSMLPVLENTQAEINEIKKYYTTDLFEQDKATETNFKKLAPKYSILHLAMHTIINDENPQFSKLIFYRNSSDTSQDGMLNASELINMQLNAEMAVLSACNTGTGKLSKGEGVMSLARDFMYAGVPGIVMTLWSVQDRSGARLMEYFYKYISQGKPRHDALRLAKMEYLQSVDKLMAHPHYWASYVNIGDIRPIDRRSSVSSGTYLLYGALCLIIVAAGLFIMIRIRNQNKRT